MTAHKRPRSHFFVSILLVIFGVESVVMIALRVLPPMPPLVEVFVDSLSLAILSAPLLWLIIANPLALGSKVEELRLQARIASILQTSFDGILTTDRRGIISQFNTGAEKIFGYTAHEAIGQPINLLFPERALVAHRGDVAQLQGRRKNGEMFPAEVTISKLEDGHDVVVTAVVRDITARKSAEAVLSESEARFRRIMECDMIGLAFRDISGRISEANDAYLRIVGFTQDDVRSGRLNWRDMTPPEYRTLDENAQRELVATGACTPYEKEYFRKDGSRVPILIGAATYPQLPGQGIAFVLDITERTQAEAGLRLQSAALTSAADAIVITDRNGAMEWVNPSFTALTGYHAEEAIGKNLREVVKSGVHDQGFFKDMWDTILAGKVWHGEITNRRKDGSLYSVQLTITPVRDDRGEIAHFIAIQRDLTEQKRLSAQLLQSQKMEVVGQLAAGVAHDFNNHLTVILSWSDFLLEKPGSDAEGREMLQEIKTAGERAAGLTRQLLAFSRKQVLAPRVLDLNVLVAEADRLLRRLIGENVELRTVLAPALGAVLADPGQVEQVIMNLVVNARDAMPDGGTLTIETANAEPSDEPEWKKEPPRSGRYVMVAVRDSGVGMDAETRSHLFEPFFTTKGAGKGTGLGLATVFGIVQQSGGFVGVSSEVGTGTTFRVYLPRAEQAAVIVESVSGPHPTLRGTETVLVAEDEGQLRDLIGRILESRGYTVLLAENSEQAWALAAGHDGPIQLLLTDVIMPGMSGRELACQLATTRPQLRVLYMSGYTDDAILHHGVLQAGIAFLQKPFTPTILSRKVREVLDAG